jgi:hypothetical protein
MKLFSPALERTASVFRCKGAFIFNSRWLDVTLALMRVYKCKVYKSIKEKHIGFFK